MQIISRPNLPRLSVFGGWFVLGRLCRKAALALLVVGIVLTAISSQTRGQSAGPSTERFFENEIRPLLVDHCIKCHGPEKQEGDLRLDTEQAMLEGGYSGPSIEPGNVQDSLLVSAIRYEGYEMPPSGQLDQADIEKLVAWVEAGATWPAHADDGGLALRAASKITEADREYWAFQALSEVEIPSLDAPPAEPRVRNPIDAFIQRRLFEESLGLAPAADRQTVVRRLYLDLLGVPPTPDEALEFLNDTSPNAYQRLVDRLLDDPRYGEKWARHWLDLVRYAESDGFNQDAMRPTAYLYRDWVIKALNDDKPYDQFVLEQLAGDEIAPDDPLTITATGYLRHWIYEYNQRDVRTQWTNILNDLTDVTGEVFLGLGIGCARCHDHKFDPILQKDYYRLQSAFASFLPVDDQLHGTPEELQEYRQQLSKWEAATEEIRAELKQLEQPIRESKANAALNKFPLDVRPFLFKPLSERTGLQRQLSDLAHRQVLVEWSRIDFSKSLKGEAKQRWEELQEQLKEFDDLKPEQPPHIMAAGEIDTQPPVLRVPPEEDGEPVEFRSLEVLGASSLQASRAVQSNSGRRTALAEWINSPDNPLAHRVIVNRIWQYHFGTGLVPNSSDFGRMGSPPSHPELLDWLATWFLENGRSFKALHRLIVTSATYRQSARAVPPLASLARQIDPDNRLLWHYPARRLDAEQIRDSILVASGTLKGKHAGPSADHDSRVRSVYTKVKRNRPHPFLNAFDAPDGSSTVGKRSVTTTPNQSLLLVNAEWPFSISREMAKQLSTTTDSPAEHIRTAYLRCFQRLPSRQEADEALAFLREITSANVGDDATEESWFETAAYREALGDFCHVLFNSSEFLYIR